MAKRTMYSFYEKKHTKKGIISTILSGVSFLVFLVLTFVSYYLKGNAGLYAGSIGLTAMIISIYGLVLGFQSFQEPGKLYLFSKIGSILNGLIAVGWLSLILIGL
ncbi:MAG TPA: hypothetical protein IAC41_03545 [Candidatus Merdenecus merdavium]|nr:hypothetical protein [Candidatus Merdenecus merdavium]